MAADGYFTKDQVIEILDYLAKGIATENLKRRRGPPVGGEAPPPDTLMSEFIDRVRRIKGACEVDGHWPPKEEDDDAMSKHTPPLVLPLPVTRRGVDKSQVVSESEVRGLTRTLRYLLGLPQHPACELPTVKQVEALRPRANQLGKRWKKMESTRKQTYGGIPPEALLRMFGKLNAWEVEDVGRVQRAWSKAVKDRTVCRKQKTEFRYYRSDPYRIMRAEKYGSWNVLE